MRYERVIGSATGTDTGARMGFGSGLRSGRSGSDRSGPGLATGFGACAASGRNVSLSVSLSALFVLSMIGLGCATQHPFVWAEAFQEKPEPRVIQARDTLSVVVKNQAQLSGEFVVRENGAYLQPLVGDVDVEGLSTEQAASRLTEKLQGILTSPIVTLSISRPRPLLVSVVGEVRQPGNFELPAGDGVLEAIARAGGLTEFAAEDDIYVLRRSPARLRIRFRYADLTGGTAKSSGFQLRDGDVVVVD
ncbi:MAG: polysaccharide biosynthesis/export family protein [Deltaproteobacteria bacterium]|nr:polysaccharide biosynthesis/export family protein [Deltaproteobacteria bacterium]